MLSAIVDALQEAKMKTRKEILILDAQTAHHASLIARRLWHARGGDVDAFGLPTSEMLRCIGKEANPSPNMSAHKEKLFFAIKVSCPVFHGGHHSKLSSAPQQRASASRRGQVSKGGKQSRKRKKHDIMLEKNAKPDNDKQCGQQRKPWGKSQIAANV